MNRNWLQIIAVVSFFLAIFGIIYAVACRTKDDLIKDINGLINEGRSLPTWDDRSEYKLPQWLEWNEEKLHRKNVISLFVLRHNVLKYLKIHYDMMVEEDDEDAES